MGEFLEDHRARRRRGGGQGGDGGTCSKRQAVGWTRGAAVAGARGNGASGGGPDEGRL